MSTERDLISKILETRDLSVISDAGVTPNFFLDPEHREVFKSILEHQSKWSQVPTVDAFRKNYPEKTYRLTEAGDTLPYYVDQLVTNYSMFLLESGLSEAVDLYESGDPQETKDVLARTLGQLNAEVSGSKTVDLTSEKHIQKRMERYKAYARNEGALQGISTGFEHLDTAIGGFQKKQLITFAGPPKAGKSTLLLMCMIAAHMGFFRPLFIGFEMTNQEQEERHDAIRARISHRKLREGSLSADDFKKMELMTRRLESMPPLIFSEDANSTLTLSGVASQIERHKPDIAFIDGVYMMEDENGERKGSPQAITNITRGFKQMAKNEDIPIGISTQVLEWKMDRKRGVTSNSIGYSSSFGQDSDQVISVEGTDDPCINKMKSIMGRNNTGMEFYVKWNWETGEFVELDDYEEDGEEAGEPDGTGRDRF